MYTQSILKTRTLQTVAFLPSLALIGCGIGVTATSPTLSEAPVAMYGTLKGGNVPISHATVSLYEAGNGGYGLNISTTTGHPHLRATAYTSDTTGAFSFTDVSNGTNDGSDSTWHCPTDGSDPLIYLVSVGGDPTGNNNHSVNVTRNVLAAMIGNCSTISSNTVVNINEVTTVALAASFGQYMYPGSSTPGQEGISTNGAYLLSGTQTHQSAVGAYNAYLNYTNNLVDIPSGNVIVSRTYQGAASSVSSVVVTATPEAAKLVATGNILSACVNSDPSDNTNCSQLFDGAQPPQLASATTYGSAFPAAVDTLQAAMYMTVLNPAGVTTAAGANTVSTGGACSTALGSTTTNPACLWSLQPKNPAFTVPPPAVALTAAPSDWSIGITYNAGGGTDSGGVLTPATTNTCTGGGPFLWATIKGQVDASGNLWFIGGDGTSSSTTGFSNIAEMTPYGQPLLCLGNHADGAGLTIDPSGNVWGTWLNSTTTGLGEIKASSPTSVVAWATPDYPTAIAADGNGNLFFTAATNGGTLYEIAAPTTPPGAGTSGTSLGQIDVASAGVSTPIPFIAVDYNGNVFTSEATTNKIFEALNGNGVHYSGLTQWSSTAATGGFATYSFIGWTNAEFIAGETITLAGFTSAKSQAPTYPALNGTFTVASANSTKITISVPSTYGSTITNQTGDNSTATATVNMGNYDNQSYTTNYNSTGIAVDGSGYVYTGTNCCGSSAGYDSLLKYSVTSAGTANKVSSATGLTFYGGLNGTRAVALDGAANAWILNEFSSIGDKTSTTFFPIVEMAATGAPTGTVVFTALSPTGPTASSTACAASTGCPTGGGFLKSDVSYSHDLNIDPSGNVWIYDYTGNIGGGGNSGSIVQIVGAAVPVVTPITPGTSSATTKLATKP